MKGFSAYLFWDVDPDKVEIDKHQSWLVRRVLEKGTWEDWKKLRQLLTKAQLIESIKGLRSLEKRAMSFACASLGIEKETLRCYKESQSLNTHWNY